MDILGWVIILTRPSLWPFVGKALQARKKATWPGCRSGYNDCMSLTCMCVERRPSGLFIVAAATRIKEQEHGE